jgi:hypothetical protein
MARIFYKYLPPGDDKEPVPIVLRTQTFLASDARDFNDPFEVRPYFDQERHDYYAGGHEDFYGRAVGARHSLLKNRSMVGIPVENVVGFGDTLNRKFRDAIGKRFRVLCLSGNPKSPIMWGHYTHIYRGAVIGIDVDDPAFAKGLRMEGYGITYSEDRSVTKLPLAFYKMPAVERFDITGRLVNDPMQPIDNGPVTIFFYQYLEMLEEAYIRALTTKAQGWIYENEIRFIYDLTEHTGQLRKLGERWLVPIPPSAIREIIIGDNASIPMVDGIVDLHRKGACGDAKLLYTACHPHRFEVQAHETGSEYLLDYFRIILPAKD